MSNYYDFTIRLISRFLNDILLDYFSGVYLSDGITAIISLVNHFSDCFGYRQSKPHLSLLCIFVAQLHNFGKKKKKNLSNYVHFCNFSTENEMLIVRKF